MEATIQERTGRIKGAICKIKAIIEDLRMQCIGGLGSAFDLWELAVLPSLLNNSETWTEISEEALKQLENLQDTFLRSILQTPQTTPKPALKFETGTLPIKYRIYTRKLCFVNSLRQAKDESLSREILIEQERLQLPGLAQETKEICRELNLPNIMRENIPTMLWKREVKKACKSASEKELKSEMEEMSKVKELTEEAFERKDYMKTKNIHQARMMFKLRSRMLDVKMNYKKDPRNSKSEAPESQAHVLHCPAYQSLRNGKDINKMEDVVSYYTQVMLLRSQLGITK